MTGAEYPFKMIGGVPVLTAPAEIDITTSAGLRSALSGWHSRGHATVVVDLTGTVFCDLAGLRELALAHRRAEADGGGLRLVTPAHGAFPRIFALTSMDGVIPHFATVRQALAQVPADPASLLWAEDGGRAGDRLVRPKAAGLARSATDHRDRCPLGDIDHDHGLADIAPFRS